MVRAILEDGLIRPLGTLPAHWTEGQELVIDEMVATPSPEDLESWSREVAALAAEIPPEDFDRLETALEEADREAKAHVRRQMDLD
jgi:hypothetical protein